MQYDKPSEITVTYKALTVRQPLADEIAFGKTDHLLMKRGTLHRGEIIIVSASGHGERDGMVVGSATIDDCKAVEGGILWKFKNPRRMVEMPVRLTGRKDRLWDLYYTEGELTHYPEINLRPFITMLRKNQK